MRIHFHGQACFSLLIPLDFKAGYFFVEMAKL